MNKIKLYLFDENLNKYFEYPIAFSEDVPEGVIADMIAEGAKQLTDSYLESL